METKQTFTREIKGHFNLREPKGKKPTAIFFVVSLNGRQYKFSTGVKVYPKMWNKKNGSAIISNQQTKQDNKNNKVVNERISEILTLFSDFKLYLCNQEREMTDIPVKLKSLIYKDMAKIENKINTEKMLENAFNYYYTYIKKGTKESTKTVEWRKVTTIFEFIEEKKLEHDISVFTQSGINALRQYLIEKGKTVITTNYVCTALVRYINNVLCVNTEYLEYKLQPVKYINLEDNRENEEKGNFPLNESELLKLETCDFLEPNEIKYRDIFLLQCEIGWRVSDLQQLINGNYEEDEKTIKVVTIKKGVEAYAYKTERLINLLEKVKAYRPLSEHWRNKYDAALKKIAKKAGLNRTINYVDTKGVKHEMKVYEKISSHWARHTKVVLEHKKGTPKEIVIKMTGHKDTVMIDKVYTKLTSEEKKQEFVSYFENKDINGNLKGTEKDIQEINNNYKNKEIVYIKEEKKKNVFSEEQLEALNKLFAWNKAKLLNSMIPPNNFKLENEIINTVKNMDSLTEYKPNMFNDVEICFPYIYRHLEISDIIFSDSLDVKLRYFGLSTIK